MNGDHSNAPAPLATDLVAQLRGWREARIDLAVKRVTANAADEIERLEAQNNQLLEALRKIISDGDYTAPEEMKRVARAAIAKATGEHS